MKRRATTGIRMNRRQKIQKALQQLKAEDQALRLQLAEEERVRAKSLTENQLYALLAEEGIELREGKLYVPLSWVAHTRRPALRQSLALIPRAR